MKQVFLFSSLNKKHNHCVKSVQMRSFSGPYFPVFSANTEKYGPEKTPYLDTFHAVNQSASKYTQNMYLNTG